MYIFHFLLYRGNPKGGDGLTNMELGVERLGLGGFIGSVDYVTAAEPTL